MELNLPVYRFRAEFTAHRAIRFPAYAGSTWRGLFGHTLRRSLCVTGAPHCDGCLLSQQCLYRYIFETPPPREPETIVKHLTAAPHPFVLRPLATSGATLQRGDVFSIEIILFGNSHKHLPYIVHTLQQMGRHGFKKPRTDASTGAAPTGDEFTLQGLWQTGLPQGDHAVFADNQTHPLRSPVQMNLPDETVSAVTLEFLTPYRSVHKGKLVHAGQFSAQAFLTTLLRRLSLLQAVHTDQALAVDFHALREQAVTVSATTAALRWHDWQRYSSRQGNLIKMGGLRGRVTLTGEALNAFLPFIYKGMETHVGKGAVMGLGHYRVLMTDEVT